ncbi:MAG: ribose 5-phosphate isomerase B [Bacteroidales bacterium]|nr:ribose 5-phosphate isomerase B [Bacteroidales bacterium]
MTNIGFACDHAGYEIKTFLIEYLKQKGYEIIDFGTNSTDSCDYPDFAHPLAEAVEKGECIGFAICGTGNGISMTANKHQGVRCALCWDTEIALLARQHNDANICGMPARFLSKELAAEIAETFLKTKFEGGRHERRINKIPVK